MPLRIRCLLVAVLLAGLTAGVWAICPDCTSGWQPPAGQDISACGSQHVLVVAIDEDLANSQIGTTSMSTLIRQSIDNWNSALNGNPYKIVPATDSCASGRTPDIRVVKNMTNCQNPNDYACSTGSGNPSLATVHIAPKNFTTSTVRAVDMKGRLSHEIGHQMGEHNNRGCPFGQQVIGGSCADGHRDDICPDHTQAGGNTVQPSDVAAVRQAHDDSTKCHGTGPETEEIVEGGGGGGGGTYCGDGNVDSGEECDDTNNNDGDGCSSSCEIENTCGDGWCDSFEGEDCESCESDCGSCGPVCGDGWCDAGEDCSSCDWDCGNCCYPYTSHPLDFWYCNDMCPSNPGGGPIFGGGDTDDDCCGWNDYEECTWLYGPCEALPDAPTPEPAVLSIQLGSGALMALVAVLPRRRPRFLSQDIGKR